MPSSPLVSIISASWNQGKYLQECIDSLKGDHSDSIEHIVVDNCSDDETGGILRNHPDIIAIIEPDGGQSEALNKGFRKAGGEWILWLNVDDFLLPGALSAMIEVLKKEGENLDMIYGHMVFVDGNSKMIRTIYQPKWYYWMTKIGCYAAPSTGSLYRRSLLVENPLDEDFHMIMDTEWMLRMGKTLRVKRLDYRTVSFRLDNNKTADHIQIGMINPQHQKERDKLGSRYSTYPGGADDHSFRPRQVFLKALRKLTRLWVLGDKFLSKYLRVRPIGNQRLMK